MISKSASKIPCPKPFLGANIEKPLISFAGVIGVGKSTLAERLSQVMGLPFYKEDVKNNPYLPLFYKNMKEYSFRLQVYLLNKRFSEQKKIIQSGEGGVQDRSIYEDGIFAKMLTESDLMDPLDYQTYLDLSFNAFKDLARPTMIVYLVADPATCYKRIQERGREMEMGITLEYLQKLHEEYENYMNDIDKMIPVIKIRWDEYKDVDKVAEAINRKFSEKRCLNYLDVQ